MTQIVSNPDDLGCPSSTSIDKSPKFPEEWAEVVTIQPAGGNLTCFSDKQGTHVGQLEVVLQTPRTNRRLSVVVFFLDPSHINWLTSSTYR